MMAHDHECYECRDAWSHEGACPYPKHYSCPRHQWDDYTQSYQGAVTPTCDRWGRGECQLLPDHVGPCRGRDGASLLTTWLTPHLDHAVDVMRDARLYPAGDE